MKSTLKLIRRFFTILVLSVLLLLVVNLTLFIAVTWKTVGGQSPWKMAESISSSLLIQEDGSYQLDASSADLLARQDTWAILVENGSGNVIWQSDGLPSQIPLHYSLSEMSQALRGYVADYPTTYASHGEDLLILGHPKTSYWKLMWNTFDYSMISNAPKTMLLFLGFNACIILIIYLASTSGILRAVKPIVQGVEALPDGQDIAVREKGLFSQLAASINRTSQRLRTQEYQLKKKEAARADWIAGVSHDVRTPLSMVMGYAVQLEEDPSLPKEARKKAGTIRLQSIRMKNLINDLNLASKLEYHTQPVHLASVNAVALLRKIVVDFLNLDPEGTYPITWDTDEALTVCLIQADEKLLQRAVSNLIVNAQVHNPEGCSITVRLAKEEHQCRITVADNGYGISDEDLVTLRSTPHYLLSDGSTGEQRHGLGLLIVRQIAEAHGGQVEIGHSESGGFQVDILLPC